jgi:hypothetical protein
MNDNELELDLEGSGRGLIEVIFWYFLGGTEKSHKEPQSV